MKDTKTITYAVIIIALLIAAFVLRAQQSRRPAPSAAGYVSGWFACKGHPGWLCSEDGQMKPNPDWKGEREKDPWKLPEKPQRGPEG